MKSFLLNSFLILAIFFFNAVNSDAQTIGNKTSDSVQTKDEAKNSLKSGKWALLFGIGSDFTLTNFDDATIAVKYLFSSKSALRLDFNMDYFNMQVPDPDYTLNQERDFGGNLTFLYYFNPKDNFNIYLGLGVNFSYHYYYYAPESGYTQESTFWITGPKIGAGAEYFLLKQMSLFAEYNYILGFGKREESFYGPSNSESRTMT